MPKKTEKSVVKTAKAKKVAPKVVAVKAEAKPKAPKPAPLSGAKATPVKPVAVVAPAPKLASKPVAAPKTTPKTTYFFANGKRKTSVACVRLHKDGKGVITINERSFENYFPVFTDQDKVLSPLKTTNNLKSFDISVIVHGGGIHSQAEAVRHGIAKALLELNAEHRSALKPLGFLTRDSRIKERKKYGLKRARRAPQWQKR